MRVLPAWRYLWVVLWGGLMMSGIACQSSQTQQKQLKKVDSLQQLITGARQTMVIQKDSIESRRERIEEQVSYISRHYDGDTVGRELQMRLTDYKGMGKTYGSFLKRYEAYQYENKQHRERIENLRRDVVEGHISSEQFDKIYRDERELLQKHLEEVRKLVRNITQLEPVYQRTQPKVESLYEKLKARQEGASSFAQPLRALTKRAA